MLVLVLARVKGNPAIYGVLVDTRSYPGTVQGVAGPLADSASRRRFLAGNLPADPARAGWGQRQRWAFPLLDLRVAPVALQAAAPVSPSVGTRVATVARPRASIPAHACYRQEYVRCGKATCTACSARAGHGPYWYAYWRQNGRLHKRYLGKERAPAG
jgi:hypothetical protein